MEDMVTRLRHDRAYLGRILDRCVLLSFKRDPGDRALRSVLHEYLVWVTRDALEDVELAAEVASTLASLRDGLERPVEKWKTSKRWMRVRSYHTGYLSALEALLDAAHQRDLQADRPLTREEFMDSWRLARKALEL